MKAQELIDKAVKWFWDMRLEDQFYITIRHNDLIEGDRATHPSSLSDSEIVAIYKAEELTLNT